jgi:hypothetical protein
MQILQVFLFLLTIKWSINSVTSKPEHKNQKKIYIYNKFVVQFKLQWVAQFLCTSMYESNDITRHYTIWYIYIYIRFLHSKFYVHPDAVSLWSYDSTTTGEDLFISLKETLLWKWIWRKLTRVASLVVEICSKHLRRSRMYMKKSYAHGNWCSNGVCIMLQCYFIGRKRSY